jgi:hypothetical protein
LASQLLERPLSVLGSLLGVVFRRPSPAVHQKIADQQLLTSDWIEIKLDKPLPRLGDFHEIGLALMDPFKVDLLGPLVVRASNGSLVSPEVELITSDGLRVLLTCSGGIGQQFMSYRLYDESRRPDFVCIRVRADHEIPLTGVYWTGIVLRNMK